MTGIASQRSDHRQTTSVSLMGRIVEPLIRGRGAKLVEGSIISHGYSNRILFGTSLARPFLVSFLFFYC